MANNNEHSNWLFRRFLRGETGPREEASLEQYAKSDDFLADALDGLRNNPEVDHEAAVKHLKNRLPRRTTDTPPLSIWRVAAAASILLLIGTAVFLLPNSLNTPSESVAMVETEALPKEITTEEETSVEVPAASPPPTSPSSTAKGEISVPAASSPPPPSEAGPAKAQAERRKVESKRPSIPPTTDISEEQLSPAAPTPITALSDQALAEEEVASPPQIASKQSRQIPAITSAPVPLSDRAISNGNRRVISGYVTDENDQPLMDINIALPGQPIGEKTDSSGYFQLRTDQTIKVLHIDHPDYQSAEIALPTGESEVQISLESKDAIPDEEWKFNGAITTIYPNPVKSAAALTSSTIKELRKAMLENKPTNIAPGKVRVSFSVQEDGSLTDFRLSGKSSRELQAYVRRYLQQNSTWKLIRGEDPARVYMVFNFKE